MFNEFSIWITWDPIEKNRILKYMMIFLAMNQPWTSTFQDYTPADINIGFNPIPIGTYYRAELHNGTLQSLGPPKSGLKLLDFQEVCLVKELNNPTGRLQMDHGFTCLSVYVITQESMHILFEFTTYQRIGGPWWLCVACGSEFVRKKVRKTKHI